MTQATILRNPSAQRHSEWEVRSVLQASFHWKAGAMAQLFEFRRRGEQAAFQFLFLGGGLGAGFLIGSNLPFPNPFKLVWDTTALIGTALWETGRGLTGKPLRAEKIAAPKWEEAITGFASIECGRTFSAIDLNRSMGRLTTACATAAFGYGATVISAYTLDRIFFESQELVGGQAGGIGVGGSVNKGVWLQID